MTTLAQQRSARSQGSGAASSAQTPPLFDRICNVTAIGRPGTSSSAFVAQNPQFFQTTGNAITVEGGGAKAAISFAIRKNLSRQPNTCELTILNLAPDSRDFFTTKPLRVDIEAGHNGVGRLLWTGDLMFGYSRHDGVNWVTKVNLSDGLQAYAYARVNRSYKPPVRVDRVLKDVAASMGLTLPDSVLSLPVVRQPLPSSVALQGPARDALSDLLAPYGYNWSFQNGQLQVLRDTDVRPGAALLVNQDSGLVGSPELTPPRNPQKSGKGHAYRGSEVKFRALLWPEMIPGCLVQLESQTVTGIFKLTDVEHTGYTREHDWYTNVTGRPVIS